MRWVKTPIVVTALVGGMVVFAQQLPEAPPFWAFPTKPQHAPVPPKQDPQQIERVAGSTAAYTAAQLQDEFFAPAWFPAEHPPMPKSVALGDRPGARPCAYCHQETGEGGPEPAALTGLSVDPYQVEATCARLGVAWQQPMEADQMQPRAGNQGRQTLQEVQRRHVRCSAPSRHGVFSFGTTRSAALHCSRSWASAGRVM